jgi:hypothetical protein
MIRQRQGESLRLIWPFNLFHARALSLFSGIASQVGSILVIIYMVKVNACLDWLRSIITSVIVIIVSGVILAVVGLM